MGLFSRIYRFYRWIVSFFVWGLWEPTTGTARLVLIGTARRLIVTTRLFFRENMQFRASALTYSSLLSAVPLLAIIFAVAKGFGLAGYVETWIRTNIAAKPEIVDTLVGFVQSYLAHTQGGIFLGFGVLMLLWTLFNLTSSIEMTFNQIWQVERQRPVFRMLTDYTAVFFLLPVFIVVTSGLTIYATTAVQETVPDVLLLRPAAMTAVKAVPYIIVCLFFSALFAFMPNTQVKFRSALVAGIPTGIIFQILQTLYIHSQLWLSSYNAIYGSFAALPLFMLMCQLSWMLTLFGGTLCYVDQNIHSFYYGHDGVEMSRLDRDCLSIRLSVAICKRFAEGKPPLSAAELAEMEQIHLRIVTDVLHGLAKAGIIMRLGEENKDAEAAYAPACDLRLLTLPRLLSAIDRSGQDLAITQDSDWKTVHLARKNMFHAVFPDTPLHRLPHGFPPADPQTTGRPTP